MATINFLYRSTKETAFLNLRLLFRHNDNDFVLGANTKIEVSKNYWNEEHKFIATKPRDANKLELYNDLISKQEAVNTELKKIENYILNKFISVNPDEVNKDWLKLQVDLLYNPIVEKPKKIIPTSLVDYIPYYLEKRENEMKPTSVTKYNVIKNKLQRMEAELFTHFQIEDVNLDFKALFENYYDSQKYSKNTKHRELGFIKTICRHARTKDVPTSKELDILTLDKEKVDNIYFSKHELNKLESLKDLLPHLDNARDWLVISCHCAQRISDFMRFNKGMITEKKGVKLINFTQKKTNKQMTIALSGVIQEILKKRNGNFPHSISDQKYNDYIKIVCKIAGFNELIKGKKQENIAKDKDENKKMRSVMGVYPKYELVCSHIGRRTMATLKRKTMPLSLLMSMTGHTTEAALNSYLKMDAEDKAVQSSKYL